MIIKSMSRRTGIKQLLTYIFKEERLDEHEGSLHFKPITIKHNVTGRNVNRFAKQFEFNENLRKIKRPDRVVVYHEVISFSIHDREHLNAKILKDISRKYIEERGKENLYVMHSHLSKQHLHIHAAVSGSQFLNGKANRMSKAQFEKMKINLEEYQKKKYPELKASIVYTNREKGKKTDKKTERQSNRNNLIEVVEKAYSNSHSVLEFETYIQNQGHKTYYRADTLAGIVYNGEMKFRFSKLGFDAEKLQKLEERENEFEKQLMELEEIRNGSKEKEKDRGVRERYDEDEVIDSFDEEDELVEENEQ